MGLNDIQTPNSIYLMHKYWGKKPSHELKQQILKYTKDNETVLDPFAGYGGIGIESIITGRNVILNDLNPSAVFISQCILEQNIDFIKLEKLYKSIKMQYEDFRKMWYSFNGNEIVTILRNKNDEILKIKIKNSNNKLEEIKISKKEASLLKKTEDEYEIKTWYPKDKIIQNPRINSNGKLYVSDLFPKRALICQSFLFDIINKIEPSCEKNLLLLSFTSNLANCSKLVPPIISRGEMSQGAWMTGFYIGETYLENNVFHYFENRVKKIIKGKKDFLSLANNNSKYEIICGDAKKLNLATESIDFVFTDFPYGDTIPYFEQSQLWNSWLKEQADYENEIVVSDSKERKKTNLNFANDIEKAISEICRVLKYDKYFTFTFHSLNGDEWEAISNAIQKNDFEFVELKLLTQKTLPPRQINRKLSIKGDLVVTYKKVKNKSFISNDDIKTKIRNEIKLKCKKNKLYDTNEIIILSIECLLKFNTKDAKIDFMQIIKEYFILDEENSKWFLK